MDWGIFFYIIGASIAAWLIFRTIKNKPEMFSSENFLKSSKVLAVLALLLITFIALVVNLL
jgi:hypothetical protein